ncbi:MAG: bifunctional oligoribonuclease/PAP phosphatase NrnA [bacterium]|nr:bifunctional oligoribonuclease/PAP phosphatase NrnA [bacterium]
MLKKLDDYLDGVSAVGIAGHIKPDGDCVGSSLAVYNYIRDQYPDVQVTLYLEPIPNIFKFLKRADEIVSDFSKEKVYDLFICLDCGDAGRLGEAAKYFENAGDTLCVDHHISNDGYAKHSLIVPNASSTCELVYELLDEKKLTKDIAECLYVGLIHDTGVFQYSCTSSKTMNIAGKLMDLGIDYPTIVDKTFFEKTYEQNLILGTALLKAERYFENRCIACIITAEDMKNCNALPKHLEGIVAQLRSTKGVDVAVLLYENGENTFKVSMRTNGAVDVAQIAAIHGGGGHVRAAGITMTGDAKEILAVLLEEIHAQLV